MKEESKGLESSSKIRNMKQDFIKCWKPRI